MTQIRYEKTNFNQLYKMIREPISDQRGYFNRLFCQNSLTDIGITKTLKQINQSFTTKKGSIRGMHFQYPPYTETKIVSCLSGKVLDVVVDLRQNSATFLQWYGTILSEDNFTSLVIPDGFAHGFQTLSDNCLLIYFHTEFYRPEHEGALNVFDPMIEIDWPEKLTDISERDNNHPYITEDFEGLAVK